MKEIIYKIVKDLLPSVSNTQPVLWVRKNRDGQYDWEIEYPPAGTSSRVRYMPEEQPVMLLVLPEGPPVYVALLLMEEWLRWEQSLTMGDRARKGHATQKKNDHYRKMAQKRWQK